ncbi:hypothetical protein PIB30_057211 [Stylosanthes scabra]|uniref:SCP domain-containing protein n=1 Tax=Stylosanthes scabra TaxID=79078 RepID=A0ABU6WME1_9FABA|nr:hypothetical protein [Stylosanthes scabra]
MKMLQILTMVITCFISIFPFCLLAGNSSPAEYLKVHNDARAFVGVEPLIWNEKLESRAQKFVHDHQVDCLDDVRLENNPSGGYGQNIGRVPYNYTALYEVQHWVSNKEKYDYESNTCIGGRDFDDDCIVYVQIVTKLTTHLGCASAMCHDNEDRIVTCYYYPKGIVPGQRPY